MKRLKQIIIIILTLSAFFSCKMDFLLDQPNEIVTAKELKDPNGSQSPNAGTLQLNIDSSRLGNRTIFPSMTLTADQYIVNFSGPGSHPEVDTSMSGDIFSLDPGTWTISVEARSSGNAFAYGSDSIFIEEGKGVQLNITLDPLQSGSNNGAVDIDFSWPDPGTWVDDGFIPENEVQLSFYKVGTTPQKVTPTPGTFGITYFDSGISSGDYVVKVEAYSNRGALIINHTDLIKIYDNTTTDWSFSYTVEASGETPPNSPAGTLFASLSTGAGSSGNTELTWADNSKIENNYIVERSDDNGTNWTELVNNLPPNTTAYTDSSLSFATDYLYRVRAINDLGYSEWSNEVYIRADSVLYVDIDTAYSGSFNDGSKDRPFRIINDAAAFAAKLETDKGWDISEIRVAKGTYDQPGIVLGSPLALKGGYNPQRGWDRRYEKENDRTNPDYQTLINSDDADTGYFAQTIETGAGTIPYTIEGFTLNLDNISGGTSGWAIKLNGYSFFQNNTITGDFSSVTPTELVIIRFSNADSINSEVKFNKININFTSGTGILRAIEGYGSVGNELNYLISGNEIEVGGADITEALKLISFSGTVEKNRLRVNAAGSTAWAVYLDGAGDFSLYNNIIDAAYSGKATSTRGVMINGDFGALNPRIINNYIDGGDSPVGGSSYGIGFYNTTNCNALVNNNIIVSDSDETGTNGESCIYSDAGTGATTPQQISNNNLLPRSYATNLKGAAVTKGTISQYLNPESYASDNLSIGLVFDALKGEITGGVPYAIAHSTYDSTSLVTEDLHGNIRTADVCIGPVEYEGDFNYNDSLLIVNTNSNVIDYDYLNQLSLYEAAELVNSGFYDTIAFAGDYVINANRTLSFDKPFTLYGKGRNIEINGSGYTFNLLTFDDMNSGTSLTGNIIDISFVAGHSSSIATPGAIKNNENLTISNCRFDTNYSDLAAGAILSMPDSTLTIYECLFKANYNTGTSANGGAIYFGGGVGNLQVINSVFSNNEAKQNGGAIHCESNSNVSISGTVFDNNAAFGVGNFGGAAIYFTGGVLDIESSLFYYNGAEIAPGIMDDAGFGGAILFGITSSTSSINNCTFHENFCDRYGGAISALSGATGTLDIYNSVFTSNNFGTGYSNPDIYASGLTITQDYNAINLTNWSATNNIDNSTITYSGAGSPIGGDTLWRTSDDGLVVTAPPAALNSGDPGSLSSSDILELDWDGTSSMGAYATSPADNTPPEAYIGVNGSWITDSNMVNLNLEGSDNLTPEGSLMMNFSLDNSNWSGWTSFSSTHTIDIGAGEGMRDIYFKVRDTANNESSVESTSLVYDNTAPTPGTLHSPAWAGSPENYATDTLIINWDNAADSVFSPGELEYRMVFSDIYSDVDSLSKVLGMGSPSLDWTLGKTDYVLDFLNPGQEYHVSVAVRDPAGNTSFLGTVSRRTPKYYWFKLTDFRVRCNSGDEGDDTGSGMWDPVFDDFKIGVGATADYKEKPLTQYEYTGMSLDNDVIMSLDTNIVFKIEKAEAEASDHYFWVYFDLFDFDISSEDEVFPTVDSGLPLSAILTGSPVTPSNSLPSGGMTISYSYTLERFDSP